MMNNLDKKRIDSLLLGGIPKWIRVYDNGGVGGGGTVDRYTVIFTNLKLGVFPYLAMSGAPFHPQGFCQHGETRGKAADRPSYGHLGSKIDFLDLPEDCRKVVLSDYIDYWELGPHGQVAHYIQEAK
jgi:hypothetical protein